MDVAAPVIQPEDPRVPILRASAAARGMGRVVAYRPTSPWPVGRYPAPRIRDPFRAFPHRRLHLIALMYADDAGRSADRRPTR